MVPGKSLPAGLLVLVAAASSAASERNERFELPSTHSVGFVPRMVREPGPLTAFWERNGPGWVVYWDEALETPRFVSPRSRLVIARPGMRDEELALAVSEFVEENRDFFGVTGRDLVDPVVMQVRKHRLVGFSQESQGVPVRGAGLRVLLDEDGAVASVDAFLARASRLPQGTPEWVDENRLLTLVPPEFLGRIGIMDRQLLFPETDVSTAVPGYCLEVMHADGRAEEVFYDSMGLPLGACDAYHYFEPEAQAEPLREGSMVFQGKSPDPEDIYATADRADGFYPIPDAMVFTSTGNRTLTGTDGTTSIFSPHELDNVWPALAFGLSKDGKEPCLDEVMWNRAGTGKNEGDNLDKIKLIAMVLARTEDRLVLKEDLPLDLFQPGIKFTVDPRNPIVFRYEEDNLGLPTERLEAFDLMAYHHVRAAHMSSMRQIETAGHLTTVRDQFPVRVVVNARPVTDPSEEEDARYVGFECNPQIRISQAFGRETWVPGSIIQHEYGHHVVAVMTGSDQNDGFVDGLADVVATFAMENPRMGFIAPGTAGRLGKRVDDPSFLGVTQEELLDRFTGATFWKLKEELERFEAFLPIELFYTWMSHRQVTERHQKAFDPAALLEQLLVADAVVLKTKLTAPPYHMYQILTAFPQRPLFLNPFIRGDVDRNGEVDMSDAVNILLYLFQGGTEDRCLVAMDIDDSASLDVSDAIWLLGYLFLGSDAPQEPFPDCGPDPTSPDLWCKEPPDSCR